MNIRVIRRIEKGEANPELKTLLRLAIALKTKIADLFDYDSKVKFVVKDYGKYNFEKLLIIEKKKLGKRILQLCIHRGIDQEELGVLSRIASSDISHYKNGEENLVLLTLLKISIGLEIRMSELFDYNGKIPDNVFQGKIQVLVPKGAL